LMLCSLNIILLVEYNARARRRTASGLLGALLDRLVLATECFFACGSGSGIAANADAMGFWPA